MGAQPQRAETRQTQHTDAELIRKLMAEPVLLRKEKIALTVHLSTRQIDRVLHEGARMREPRRKALLRLASSQGVL